MTSTHLPSSSVGGLTPLLEEMGRLLQWATHDGLYEPGRAFWEQDIQEFRTAWEHLTHPGNADLLRARLGTAGNAEWNRLFDEAYRQSLARSDKPRAK